MKSILLLAAIALLSACARHPLAPLDTPCSAQPPSADSNCALPRLAQPPGSLPKKRGGP